MSTEDEGEKGVPLRSEGEEGEEKRRKIAMEGTQRVGLGLDGQNRVVPESPWLALQEPIRDSGETE